MESAELLLLEEDLRFLGLTVMAEQVGQYAEQAAAENITYVAFLRDLVARETEARRNRWFETKLKLAGFPYRKTLADFDFSFQPAADERRIRQLATLSFIDRHENLVFLGPPGVGKTHLSVALGMEALHHRIDAYYTTAHALVADLRRAHLRGTMEARLRVYTKPKLLIIDELTHAPFEPQDVHHFFRLVSERYEKGSIILAANRSYGEWGQLFYDTVLASAILDRLLHHSVTVNIKNGQSYRLKDKVKAGVVQPHALTTDA